MIEFSGSAGFHPAFQIVCAALLFSATVAQAQTYLPDPKRTPGAVNTDVTQDNLAQTVCVPGWTKRIRPAAAYISRLRAQQMRALNLPGGPRDDHEDHRVPLCAGGHPTDPRNLWPQPLQGQWRDADKNQLEQSVCRQLCRGEITLEQAQAWFLNGDWPMRYEQYFELERR